MKYVPAETLISKDYEGYKIMVGENTAERVLISSYLRMVYSHVQWLDGNALHKHSVEISGGSPEIMGLEIIIHDGSRHLPDEMLRGLGIMDEGTRIVGRCCIMVTPSGQMTAWRSIPESNYTSASENTVSSLPYFSEGAQKAD